VQTVLGEISHEQMGITDGHNHLWIEPVAGVEPGAPVLDDFASICAELRLFRQVGGGSILDCQPPGCGRDANRLAQLSRETGVAIVACTGFHRRRYYGAGDGLFALGAEQVAGFLIGELRDGMVEQRESGRPARAGFIKIALEQAWADCPPAALRGAVEAARQTGALVEIHTEMGALAERVVTFFEAGGVPPGQLALCHMDKRPDFGLHRELARYGVLLEYDTFHRPKYEPEKNLWPLIERMAGAGLSASLALATDMAGDSLYRSAGRGLGLSSLPLEIRARLQSLGLPDETIRRMLGGNIARRLAGI
jgi:phosphotriesterase-related protein